MGKVGANSSSNNNNNNNNNHDDDCQCNKKQYSPPIPCSIETQKHFIYLKAFLFSVKWRWGHSAELPGSKIQTHRLSSLHSNLVGVHHFNRQLISKPLMSLPEVPYKIQRETKRACCLAFCSAFNPFRGVSQLAWLGMILLLARKFVRF